MSRFDITDVTATEVTSVAAALEGFLVKEDLAGMFAKASPEQFANLVAKGLKVAEDELIRTPGVFDGRTTERNIT